MIFISNVEADDDMLNTLANINLNEKIDLFCLAFIICLKLFDDASRCLKTFVVRQETDILVRRDVPRTTFQLGAKFLRHELLIEA